jgi:hypothetical protein
VPEGDGRTRLETQLRALGRELNAQIDDRDLAPAVTQRLTLSPGQAPGRSSLPRRSLGRGARPPRARPRLVVALVTVAATVALVVPVGAAIRSYFDVGAVRVHAPGTRGAPAVAAAALTLGSRTTLAAARQRMTVVVPTAPGFTRPDEVWFADIGGGQVSLVYRARPGLPRGAPADVGLLIQEFIGDGASVIHKHLTSGTGVRPVTIGTDQGVFLSGKEHFLYYVDPAGAQQIQQGRLVGQALIFTRGPQTIRIEGSLPFEQMLAIATSLR